jgi:hypothetical protein
VNLDDRMSHSSTESRKTEKLLAREFWRGQMHGSSGASRRNKEDDQKINASIHQATKRDPTKRGGPVHARHMRSRCSLVPRGELFALPRY